VILGIASLLVANAAALLGAQAASIRVRTGIGHVDHVLFLLLRLGILSAAVLAAGLTGTLSPGPLAIAGGVALVVLLRRGVHRTLRRPDVGEAGRLLLGFSLVLVARCLAQVWFFAPHMGDPVTYHLPKIGEWIRAGAFTTEMGLHPHVTFPAGYELIETWWVVFLHHDVLIEMAGVECLVLAFAATRSLALLTGLTPRGAWIAGLTTALVPGLYLNAFSCLNDAAMVALVLGSFVLVFARCPWPLVLVPLGLGLGVKPTFGYALPGILALGFLVRREPDAPSSRGAASALGLGAMAVGAFWYFRNLIWFGNPMYPVTSQGYAHPVPAQVGPSLGSLLRNLRALVEERITDHRGPYAADVWDISGWGPAAFACGVFALVALLRTEPRLRRLAVAFGVAALAEFTLVKLDPWCMRFVLFLPALLAIAAVRMAENLRGARWVLGAALLYQVAGTMLPFDLSHESFAALARTSWRERSAEDLFRARPPADVPAVGCFGAFSGGEYTLYRPDFSRRVAHLRAESADALVASMVRENVRLLYASPLSRKQLAVLTAARDSGALRAVKPRFYVLAKEP
jgi:hypothetical protein